MALLLSVVVVALNPISVGRLSAVLDLLGLCAGDVVVATIVLVVLFKSDVGLL